MSLRHTIIYPEGDKDYSHQGIMNGYDLFRFLTIFLKTEWTIRKSYLHPDSKMYRHL